MIHCFSRQEETRSSRNGPQARECCWHLGRKTTTEFYTSARDGLVVIVLALIVRTRSDSTKIILIVTAIAEWNTLSATSLGQDNQWKTSCKAPILLSWCVRQVFNAIATSLVVDAFQKQSNFEKILIGKANCKTLPRAAWAEIINKNRTCNAPVGLSRWVRQGFDAISTSFVVDAHSGTM